MGHKTRVVVLFFFLLTGTVFRVFPQYFILTNASDGVFATDQKLTFTLASPGWLRLLLNDREIYRGGGPAFPEFGVPDGEEREFILVAEYYSMENVFVERWSWQIHVDKKPPPLPEMEFRNTGEGLRLVISGGEQNARIRAWADVEGGEGFPVFFPDLGNLQVPPANSFQAMVWAEDLAGNY